MKKHLLTAVFSALALSISLPALAEDEKATEQAMKSHAEMHEKMAKAHEEAAECLNDKKPMDECRAKFMESAKASGFHEKHHGKHHGMMQGKGKKMGKKHGHHKAQDEAAPKE